MGVYGSISNYICNVYLLFFKFNYYSLIEFFKGPGVVIPLIFPNVP